MKKTKFAIKIKKDSVDYDISQYFREFLRSRLQVLNHTRLPRDDLV